MYARFVHPECVTLQILTRHYFQLICPTRKARIGCLNGGAKCYFHFAPSLAIGKGFVACFFNRHLCATKWLACCYVLNLEEYPSLTGVLILLWPFVFFCSIEARNVCCIEFDNSGLVAFKEFYFLNALYWNLRNIILGNFLSVELDHSIIDIITTSYVPYPVFLNVAMLCQMATFEPSIEGANRGFYAKTFSTIFHFESDGKLI